MTDDSLVRDTVAVVLAGGRGSRLGGLTESRSKPAVHFGGKYRLIDFVLSNCLNSGIGRVGIVTQYMSHSLSVHVQQGWGLPAYDGTPLFQLWPAQQRSRRQSWYAGTADAIYQNLDILRGLDREYVLVLSGDHIYTMDYRPLLRRHAETGADMTICAIECHRDEARQFGVLGVDADGSVQRFTEKPAEPETLPGTRDRSLASMGIYVFNSRFLYEQLIAGREEGAYGNDFGRDVIPALISRYRIQSYACTEGLDGRPLYWRDVGTLDALWQSNRDLLVDHPSIDLYDRRWPIRTAAMQTPPARFVGRPATLHGSVAQSLVSDGCRLSGAKVSGSVVCYNVCIGDDAAIIDSVLLPDCHIGAGCRLSRVIVDRYCQIPAGTVIGHDRASDAARFQVSDAGVTLVTQAMLDRVGQDELRRAA